MATDDPIALEVEVALDVGRRLHIGDHGKDTPGYPEWHRNTCDRCKDNARAILLAKAEEAARCCSFTAPGCSTCRGRAAALRRAAEELK